jgi:hypothetical protein
MTRRVFSPPDSMRIFLSMSSPENWKAPARRPRRGHRPSDGGVDGATAARSVSMGHRATISAPGSRSCVQRLGEYRVSDGYPRNSHSPTFAVAKFVRRTVHRVRPAGVSRPRYCPQCIGIAPRPERVRHVLPRLANSPLAGQRCSRRAGCPTGSLGHDRAVPHVGGLHHHYERRAA